MVRIIKPTGKGKRPQQISSREEIEGLKLPDEKSSPSKSLFDYSILLYGEKKIGKTSMMSQPEGVLGFMCEPGGKAQEMYQVPCKNWAELRQYTRLFIKDPRYTVGLVDTADYAYAYCMLAVCQKLCIEHPSEEDYGKGWNAVRTEFNNWVSELLHSGKGIVFISHTKNDEFKTRKNETYNKVGSSMPGQAKDILEGLIDIWANYSYDGKDRILTIGGSDEVDAGHRCEGHFLFQDNTPVLTIPMGKSPKESFNNFIAAFNNKLPKQKGEVVKQKALGLKLKKK
jgi:AAA domain